MNDLEKDIDKGTRVNLYLNSDLKKIYKKLNKNLKENGSCISQLFQMLVVNEARKRGINE